MIPNATMPPKIPPPSAPTKSDNPQVMQPPPPVNVPPPGPEDDAKLPLIHAYIAVFRSPRSMKVEITAGVRPAICKRWTFVFVSFTSRPVNVPDMETPIHCP